MLAFIAMEVYLPTEHYINGMLYASWTGHVLIWSSWTHKAWTMAMLILLG